MKALLEEHPHRRRNILTGEWVLVSPHRAKRPWQGKVEKLPQPIKPSYDENCYLCPTNTRTSGAVNPDYKKPFSFINDFSALKNYTDYLRCHEISNFCFFCKPKKLGNVM